MIAKTTKFLQDVKTEMAKVSWPTRQELKGQTWIVIIVSLFFSLFIYLVDYILSGVLSLIY